MELLKKEKMINDILILKLTQNISVENATKFEKDAFEILKDKNFKIILEISDVDYVISQALGTLIRWHKKNNDNGGFLALLKTTEKVKRIITILKLDKVIFTSDSLDEIVSHFEM